MTQRNTRRGFTQEEKDAVICPPCGESAAQAAKEGQNGKTILWPLLPCLTEVFPPQRREMFTCGFTLIELLVVALIIAILAVVALPQYQKAIRKARGTEALNTLAALDKGLTAYYLENGSYEGIDGGELLNIEISELKHFRFGVGSNAYESGSTNLSTLIGSQYALLVGSANPQVVYAKIVSPENIGLNLTWEHGQLTEKFCTEDNLFNPLSCEDYFNCIRESARVEKIQAGCPDRGIEDRIYYEGSPCYLN